MIQELIKFIQRASVQDLGRKLIASPADIVIRDTSIYNDYASTPTGTVTAESIDSLIDYIVRFGTSESAIFASSEKSQIAAIFDWHDRETQEYGGWARHQAIFPLQFSDRWKAWSRINGQNLGQKALGEFIEEYLGDIVKPDAASVLESVLTLTGKKSVNYKSATRLANGDIALVWEETTDAKAGQKGDMKVPSELTLRLPVYAGCEAETTFDIRTMFRFNIQDGHLTFQLKMLGIETIREHAFAAVFESLCEKVKKEDQAGIPIYRGAVTTTPTQIHATKH